MAVLKLPPVQTAELRQAPLNAGGKLTLPPKGASPLSLSPPAGATGIIIQSATDLTWSISVPAGGAGSTVFTLKAGNFVILYSIEAIAAFRANSSTTISTQIFAQYTQGGGQGGAGSADALIPTVDTPTLAQVNASQATYTFTLTFVDNINIAYSTLDVSKIVVSGPNGFSKSPSLQGISPAANSRFITATLVLAGPFSAASNGAYSISVGARAIFDTSANANVQTNVGSFTVAIAGAGTGLIGDATGISPNLVGVGSNVLMAV